MILLLHACAFRPPAETPDMVAARGPLPTLVVPGDHVLLAVRAGSAADPPGREGLAALAASAVAAQAGAVSFVGPELTVFRVEEGGLQALTTAIERVDATRVEAARSGLAAPETCWEIARAAFDTWVYAGHPYGHAVRGRASVVPTLTAVETQSFLAARYVRGSALVGVPSAASIAPVEALAPTMVRPTTPATLSPVEGRRMLVVEAPIGTSCAAAGHVAARPLALSERAALAVAQALGEGAVYEPRVQDRVIVGFGLQDPVDPQLAGQVAVRFAELGTVGLDEAEVRRGSAVAAESYGQHEESADLLAAALLDNGGGSLREALAGATVESVRAALAAVIDPGSVRVVVVTPDASPFRGEGSTGEDVQGIMTSSEMFR